MVGRLMMVVVLGGCATPRNVRDVLGMVATEAPTRVTVAPTTFLEDLEQPVDAMASFRASTWVGSIWMSGGYEILPEEQHQVRSVEVELSDHDAFRDVADQWVQRAFTEAATTAGWQVVPFSGPDAGWAGVPERKAVRGTVEFDGDDNLNLPRFDLVPSATPVPSLPGVDAVLVPLVVHYYAHNGGWFIGQEQGTWGGARIRVLWTLTSGQDGSLQGWGEVGTKYELERTPSPNRQELEDALLETEQQAVQILTEQWVAREPRLSD